MAQGQSPPTSPPRTKHDLDFEFPERRRSSSASHSLILKVGKLVDGYLQEIAHDDKLPWSKFLKIAEAIPELARLDHDHLYKAIDIYLEKHPDLDKGNRKRLCRILDCKKLSMEVCMQAAENELLRLRILVQVLFSDRAKAMVAGSQVSDLTNHSKALLGSHEHHDSIIAESTLFSKTMNTTADDQLSVSCHKSPKPKVPTLTVKLAEDDDLDDSCPCQNVVEESSKMKSCCAISNRPLKDYSVNYG